MKRDKDNEQQLRSVLKKTTCKVNALSITAHGMKIKKQKKFMNAFFTSKFNYCPLWPGCFVTVPSIAKLIA